MGLLSRLSLLSVLAFALPLHATEPDLPIPVVWESPGCKHDKLGTVEIAVGQRVSETTKDTIVPTVDYGRAMAKLAEAAQAQGANAVVLRWHQGVYFTRNGKQSRKPVYVKLRGGAIQLSPEALAQCPLKPVLMADLEERSRSGKPVDADSREVFAGE